MLNVLCSFLRAVYDFCFAIYRDIYGAALLVRTRLRMKQFDRRNANVFETFAKIVRKQPFKTCLIFENRIWTFKDVF